MTMLSVDDFAAFFREVHGVEPFPWQHRLVRQVANDGVWPDTLDLPTGSGKTAVIDIAVFHLALESLRLRDRRAPIRIAFVVDRRLVVDDAFERAKRIAAALGESTTGVTSVVAGALRRLSRDGPPLIARRLRGGIPREDDWARTPAQPTVLCSTVDQIGSRLLFRGYGVSDSMKPVHAGLIGSDCLLILDEVHLAEPFRQTLGWVRIYNSEHWRDARGGAPWAVVSMSATTAQDARERFSLDREDRSNGVLQCRLSASKPARLVGAVARSRNAARHAGPHEATREDGDQGFDARVRVMAEQVRAAIEHFERVDNGVPAPAVCVVLNRVMRARAVFERVDAEFRTEIEDGRVAKPILMVGPARPLDRDTLVSDLSRVRTRSWASDEIRTLPAALIVVATQCIEVGVDLDFDALITEAAPADALRQRFGRLNRAGRRIRPYAAVVANPPETGAGYEDPVYGAAIAHTWAYLTDRPDVSEDAVPSVDFGISAFDARIAITPLSLQALTEKPDAPVLLPAHVDLLSQTSPIPAADPDISLYLHGADREPDSVTVIWRADLRDEWAADNSEDARRIMWLVPPRSGEALELPLWAVRRWLDRDDTGRHDRLADVATATAGEQDRPSHTARARRVFRWMADDERSSWVGAPDLRPGDTIIAPAEYGGSDRFGWNPLLTNAVSDLAREAAEPFRGRRFAVRIAPGLLASAAEESLSDALASAVSHHWKDLRTALVRVDLPQHVREDLESLDQARKAAVIAYVDVYGHDDEGRPRGVIFHAPLGLTDGGQAGRDGLAGTEDDIVGSLSGYSLRLDIHNGQVEEKAAILAEAAGLPAPRVSDLRVAGRLHDRGKDDPRFQAWLHYGDPLGSAPEHLLAKSGRRLPRRAREVSGLPPNWRHEARSVRLISADPHVAGAEDVELVLWLVGTHHGHGRPLFPHGDPAETASGVGPQSLAFDWNGSDWPTLFERLKARYGVWELARMEAVLRLADHRASEEAAAKESW